MRLIAICFTITVKSYRSDISPTGFSSKGSHIMFSRDGLQMMSTNQHHMTG